MRSTEGHFKSGFTAPLNVSREILQESRDVEAIRNGCVKRTLGLLGSCGKAKGQIRDVLEHLQQGSERGLRRRFRQSRAAREARALCYYGQAAPKHRTSRSLITWGG